MNRKMLVVAFFFAFLIALSELHSQEVEFLSKKAIQRITSVFENSTTDFVYDYAENIGDGRGITFGFFGMTSGTFDGTQFLEEYQILNPDNTLVKYLSAFRKIDMEEHDANGLNDSTEGLDDFIDSFRDCLKDPAFIQAQAAICDRLYWNPAVELLRKYNGKMAITLGQLYDSCIQHGMDGCEELIKKTIDRYGLIGEKLSEKDWLGRYMKMRKSVLGRSGKVWKESIDRVTCYERLLENGIEDLNPPFYIDVFGEKFQISE